MEASGSPAGNVQRVQFARQRLLPSACRILAPEWSSGRRDHRDGFRLVDPLTSRVDLGIGYGNLEPGTGMEPVV